MADWISEMIKSNVHELAGRFREGGMSGTLRLNEPLSEHTSWRVGGRADQFYLPAGSDDLATFLSGLPAGEPLFWLGLGSNLLVRDGGLRGTVICTKGRLRHMERVASERVLVESGMASALVARSCAAQGLTGAEFLAGIPGTVGGALAMNAGAFGGETWDVVTRVRTVDRYGVIRWRERSEFSVGYRSVMGLQRNEWFLAAELALRQGDVAAARSRIRQLLARRAESQPTNVPSCGSTFRNPPGDFAGRLIEAAGLKGHRIGGAMVSPKHANFIVNTGSASASDIETLINYIRATVLQSSGVDLQPEVQIVGDALCPREARRCG